MLGVLVNVAAVLLGGSVGLLCKRGIPARLTDAVMLGLGLCTLYIGIDGALAGENILIVIAAMVLATPGSASILGLMHDKDREVSLLIDRDILTAEAIGAHPLVNTSSLGLAVSDLLEKFLPAVGHTYRTVTL